MRTWLVEGLLGGLLGGCAGSVINERYILDRVENRAAFDLGCEQLETTRIDTSTFGVRGCEKKATYVITSETEQPWSCFRTVEKGSSFTATFRSWFDTNCKVVLNSPAE